LLKDSLLWMGDCVQVQFPVRDIYLSM